MYGLLTKKNNGSYGMPLIEEFNRPKDVTIEAVVYGRIVWNKWNNAQLVDKGMVRIQDVTTVAAGKERTSAFSDTFSAKTVKRTYTLRDVAVEPLKTGLSSRVNGMRQGKITAGIEIVHDAVTKVLETGSESLANISAVAASIGAGLPMPLNADGTVNAEGSGTHISWRMRDNADILFTSAEFVAEIAGPAMVHVNGCHISSRVHKTAIDALTTYVEITGYDLEAGWPDVYTPPDDIL
jgi:hypothetical protein